MYKKHTFRLIVQIKESRNAICTSRGKHSKNRGAFAMQGVKNHLLCQRKFLAPSHVSALPYMYCMLLRKLGCSVSGYHLNSHITHAQLRLANTGHEFCRTLCSCSSFSPSSPFPPCQGQRPNSCQTGPP